MKSGPDLESPARRMQTLSPSEAQSLEFPIGRDGFVNHWLVAGPQQIPVPDLGKYDHDHPRPGILQDYHNGDLLVQEEPVEGANLQIDDFHGSGSFPWQLKRCEADHFIDFSTFGLTCQYIRCWAFANIISPVAQSGAAFVLTANGPFDVWINGRHVHRHVGYHYQIPLNVDFAAAMDKGENRIVVAFEVIAIRECPYAMALKLRHPAGCKVRLLTSFALAERRNLDTVLRCAALDRWLFNGSDRLQVRWPENLDVACLLNLKLEAAEGKLVMQTQASIRAGTVADLGEAREFVDGRYVLILESGEGKTAPPLSRRIPVRIANGSYSTECYGTYEERVQEALISAAAQRHLFGEIAKMELGRWDSLDSEVWTEPLNRLRRREDCSDFNLVGMLGALHRHGGNPAFPKRLREDITETALNFRYWLDEPGHDAMCFHTENHQILFHTCEVLAGQLFPDCIFPNTGRDGNWHRAKGERLAKAWLRKRGAEGLQEWDSNVYFEIDVAALAHLADLAEDGELATLSAMVLDKLFVTIARNSIRGVFGSTHGRAYSDLIKGSRLELTSGLTRMLWGMGVFGTNILGVVSLAAARKYTLPQAIHEIATNPPDEAWSRERHGGRFDPESDLREGEWEVNKVTYKTRDYMLCSAQNLSPGKPGNQQHIWQASFGPDAVTFSTHPVCISEDGYHRPNFWHGNGILPRVAQWKDFLVALYQLPEGDCMGFTHAYFPTIHFDEWCLRDGWAFARKDRGYLALTASGGLVLSKSTSGVCEELRSPGLQNIWLCQMGREAQDGSYPEFQEKVLNLETKMEALSVRTRTLRGDNLAFDWTGPFVVNGDEAPLSGFAHYEGPLGSSEWAAGRMTIRSQNHCLELDFSAGVRASSPGR